MIAILSMVLLMDGIPTTSIAAESPIPVIFDTDIGGDIDDTWALALIVSSPELDLRLVVTDTGDTVGKARIVAKFLEQIGRPDIPIGVGEKKGDNAGAQLVWAKGYDLDTYPGQIHPDGIQAMIDMILASATPMTLLVAGPCPNIEIALKRAPDIAQKARVVAMSGSIDVGYDGVVSPDAEYNVRQAISASRALYTAQWDLTIAPLDTAGVVQIGGGKYEKLTRFKNPLIAVLLENYRVWVTEGKHRFDPDIRSSILYDAVAVYLAFDQSLCEMQNLKLKVDYKGYTVRDASGKLVHCAMKWRNLEQFEDLIVQRLMDFGKEEEIEK
jgi:inosine-uridine nucleoside N-ribohydrolase